MIIFSSRWLKKSLNQQSKIVGSMQVSTWLSNTAFHLRQIWLQNLVATDPKPCQRSFPSFRPPPSEVAALFDENLSRRPFLGPVVNKAALDSICNMQICSYPLLLFRDQWIIARLSDAISAALVCNKVSQNLLELSFNIRKKYLSSVTPHSPKFTNHWNLVSSRTH